jgi:protoheme IX farnesyltransferase
LSDDTIERPLEFLRRAFGAKAGTTDRSMSDISLEPRQERAAAPEATVGDFFALLKPRVMFLVVFTGIAGLLLAPGAVHPVLAAVAILCIAVGSGAAGAVNMWYERDIDAVMKRTAARPLVRGVIAPDDALAFAVILTVLSVMVMGLALNWTAAALLALASAFYVFVYTIWLKRRTPQNIVIGGAAGAFPPMIGWAAVTGTVGWEGIVLFLIIFLWTPPHFWALALFAKTDYGKAGVPMLPVVAGERATKIQMLVYTALLLPVAPLPYFMGFAGPLYLAVSIVLGVLFLASAVQVLRAAEGEDKPARAMFAFSILYLFLLFAVLIAEAMLGKVAV